MNVVAAVIGLVTIAILLLVWAAYRAGQKGSQMADVRATLDVERQARDAVDAGRVDPIKVDDEWLRRGRPE